MRILTVRQPWAWAIIHGGKDVENRVRNIAGDYRGPVAIHVGLSYDTAWSSFALDSAMSATGVRRRAGAYPWYENLGKIIGVVDLTDVHHWANCLDPVDPAAEETWRGCSVWAEPVNAQHLVLTNPRALAEPIPYRGALGLRRLDDNTIACIQAGLS